MKVAIFNGAGKPITIEERPDDPLKPGEVRIEVKRCGICGSDVSMTSGSAFDYPAGMRMGHEISGEVIEIGRDVASLKVGDRLSVFPQGFCGTCATCRSGRPIFCESGNVQFGGFGERMVITGNSAFRIPKSVSLAEAALVEPIACGRRAFAKARLRKGDTVLILGGGSMGMAAIYWARRMGAGRVIAATRTSVRHDILRAIGADVAVATSDDPEALQRALPVAPDVVVECIGKPGELQRATELVRIGGDVISLGMCTVHDPVVPAFSAFREVSLHFPICYTPEDFAETLNAFDADEIRPEIMVSEVFGLDDVPSLIEQMRGPHDHLKIQIDPTITCSHALD